MGRRLKRSEIKPKVPVVHLANKLIYSKLSPYALAYTLAIIFGVGRLVMCLVRKAGVGMGMPQPMFSLSFSGIVVSTACAALAGLVFGFAFGWLYNKMK
jgi:hypothetical protein